MNSNRFEISSRFEKLFRLHDNFAGNFRWQLQTNRESATTYDCMKARKICNNVRVAAYQTSVFKDFQHEPRYNQSNISMCCYLALSAATFVAFQKELVARIEEERRDNKELSKIVLLDGNIALGKYKRRLKRQAWLFC